MHLVVSDASFGEDGASGADVAAKVSFSCEYTLARRAHSRPRARKPSAPHNREHRTNSRGSRPRRGQTLPPTGTGRGLPNAAVRDDAGVLTDGRFRRQQGSARTNSVCVIGFQKRGFAKCKHIHRAPPRAYAHTRLRWAGPLHTRGAEPDGAHWSAPSAQGGGVRRSTCLSRPPTGSSCPWVPARRRRSAWRR